MPLLLLAGANLGIIKTRVTNLVGSNSQISTEEIEQIIQAEHITILGDNSWSDRKAQGTVSTVPVYNTGTVSLSGVTVTGNGTTFDFTMVNRWIRVGSATQFFLITGITDATHLTIETANPAGDLTDQPFTIFQNVYSLPANCARILSLAYQDRLQDMPYEELDRLDPYRTATGTPTVYCYREISGGARQIELWPMPTSAMLLRLFYLKTNDLSNPGDIPLYRSDVLVWKSAASAAFLLFAKTGDVSWKDLAMAYLGQYEKALEGAKLDDLGRNSPSHKIRDAYRFPWRDSDYAVTHDVEPW